MAGYNVDKNLTPVLPVLLSEMHSCLCLTCWSWSCYSWSWLPNWLQATHENVHSSVNRILVSAVACNGGLYTQSTVKHVGLLLVSGRTFSPRHRPRDSVCKGGNVTSAGWQVTLCSRSGVATSRTATLLLVTYALTPRQFDTACIGVSSVTWHGPRDALHATADVTAITATRVDQVCIHTACPTRPVSANTDVKMLENRFFNA